MRVPLDLLAELEKESAERGDTSVHQLIREAIAEHVARRKAGTVARQSEDPQETE